MAPTLSLQSSISATSRYVATQLNDELVILNLENRTYYGLNGTGAFIWQQLAKPITVGAICDTVMEQYSVERDQCEHSVLSLLQELLDQKLIQVDPDTA